MLGSRHLFGLQNFTIRTTKVSEGREEEGREQLLWDKISQLFFNTWSCLISGLVLQSLWTMMQQEVLHVETQESIPSQAYKNCSHLNYRLCHPISWSIGKEKKWCLAEHMENPAFQQHMLKVTKLSGVLSIHSPAWVAILCPKFLPLGSSCNVPLDLSESQTSPLHQHRILDPWKTGAH